MGPKTVITTTARYKITTHMNITYFITNYIYTDEYTIAIICPRECKCMERYCNCDNNYSFSQQIQLSQLLRGIITSRSTVIRIAPPSGYPGQIWVYPCVVGITLCPWREYGPGYTEWHLL